MARHIFRHGQGVRDPKIMHPGREWAIGLMVTAISIIIGAVASTTIFVSYNKDYFSQNDMVEEIIPYKAALVEKAISLYQDKQDTYKTISNQLVSPVLPVPSPVDSAVNVNETKTDPESVPVLN